MGTPLLWIGFNVFVLASIALDLGVFNRRLHKVSMREATFFSLLWVALSILFGVGILHYSGRQAGLEFFTGYLIEKALSVDNLFLFLVIFRTFAIDERLQHRMLEWGILGALVMRGAMILAGAELIQRFSSEAASGVNAVDVLNLPDPLFMHDALSKGDLTSLAKANLPGGFPPKDLPDSFVSFGGAVSFVTDGSSARAMIGATPMADPHDLLTQETSSQSFATVITGVRGVKVNANATINHYLADGAAAVSGGTDS